MEVLISYGADLNATNINHQNIIVLLIIIQNQIKERNLNKNNKTPLLEAIDSNQDKSIDLLLSKGADVNIQDYSSLSRMKI